MFILKQCRGVFRMMREETAGNLKKSVMVIGMIPETSNV